MKIENQVCPLWDAKRLEELGVKGLSYFVWVPPFPVFNDLLRLCTVEEFDQRLSNSILSTDARNLVNFYSAFTVPELGAMMKGFDMPVYWKLWDEYCFKESGQVRGYGDEAAARAAKLIHLLESKLITAQEVNSRIERTPLPSKV